MCVAGYSQHTLQDYVQSALRNSPVLNDNRNQSLISDLENERLKAFYTKAQISLSANYVFSPIVSNDTGHHRFEINPNNSEHYDGYDLAASNGGVYQGLINYVQPLFNSSRYEVFAKQNYLAKNVNENIIKITSHDIEKLVTDQYILCLLDQSQMLYADSMQTLLIEQNLIVKKLVEGGLLKQSDLTILNIEKLNNLNLSQSYNAIYSRDLIDLNILCGIADTALVILDEIDIRMNAVNANSGFLEKYLLDSLSACAAQEVFETKYNPQLSFLGNAGLNAVYAPTIPNRFGFSAGLSLNWNLADGNQKNITRKKTDIQLKSISFYRDNFMTQNESRRIKILNELGSFNERSLAVKNQLKEYDSLLDDYKKEMMLGQLSVINYITVLKSVNAAKRDFFILQTNKLLLINAYNYWNW